VLQSSTGFCGELKLVGLCFVFLLEWWRNVSDLAETGGGEGVDLVERGTLGKDCEQVEPR
jgi:hypothetical protein